MGIEEITVSEARTRQLAGAVLIDVREPDEHALGVPASALRIPRAKLEAESARFIADPAMEVLLICGSGKRSMLAAQNLAAQGYLRLVSVAGGYQQWQRAGLPVETTQDPDHLERYSRHLRLPQVGTEGQAKLARARVLVVGAGGLGSPAAFYLAAAGIGFLRLVDDDVVDRSNLQRQILHTDARIGMAKVESAAQSLRALNPTIKIETVQARVSADNVEGLIGDVDLVLDGADNFPTRYLLSDACVHLAKPMVYGAVQRFDGQVSVFDAGRRRGTAPCYRCLFPQPPSAADAPNCADAGVLGVLPGLVGLMQATEVLKLLLGIGETLTGRLLQFDALGMRFRETGLRPDPDCVVCAPGAPFIGYPALQQLCSG